MCISTRKSYPPVHSSNLSGLANLTHQAHSIEVTIVHCLKFSGSGCCLPHIIAFTNTEILHFKFRLTSTSYYKSSKSLSLSKLNISLRPLNRTTAAHTSSQTPQPPGRAQRPCARPTQTYARDVIQCCRELSQQAFTDTREASTLQLFLLKPALPDLTSPQ